MGERRLRATKLAGLDTIPAVVRNTADEVMLRDALLENLHRADLNPLEEASAYQQLLADFGITQEQLADAHRPIAPADHQHDPPAQAARVGAAAGRGRRADRGARARDPVGRRRPTRWSGSRRRSSTRTCRCAPPRPRPGRSRRRRPAAKPRPGKRQGQLDEIAERLGDRLDTRVKVALGASKGTLTIEFANVADLNRILGLLGERTFG